MNLKKNRGKEEFLDDTPENNEGGFVEYLDDEFEEEDFDLE